MTKEPCLSLREAAEELGIEPLRVARLGWRLGVASTDKRISRQDVDRMALEDTAQQRYSALLHWLLASVRCPPELGNGSAGRSKD